jgi:two-component sensor histidine kinase
MIYFSRTINKKDEALIKANVELERQNIEILEQHKHLQILLKEIHHRVKNNLQIISSLMSLQARNEGDERLSAFLNESKRRVEAIALIHEKLYQDDKVNQVDFKSYLEDLMNSQKVVNPHVKCTVKSKDATLNLDTAVPLGLIISEMFANSIKHAFQGVDDPKLSVELLDSEEGFELIVQDNGIGLPEDFNLSSPSSLGFEIINALTSQINGSIEYSNENGAKFHIRFQE